MGIRGKGVTGRRVRGLWSTAAPGDGGGGGSSRCELGAGARTDFWTKFWGQTHSPNLLSNHFCERLQTSCDAFGGPATPLHLPSTPLPALPTQSVSASAVCSPTSDAGIGAEGRGRAASPSVPHRCPQALSEPHTVRRARIAHGTCRSCLAWGRALVPNSHQRAFN